MKAFLSIYTAFAVLLCSAMTLPGCSFFRSENPVAKAGVQVGVSRVLENQSVEMKPVIAARIISGVKELQDVVDGKTVTVPELKATALELVKKSVNIDPTTKILLGSLIDSVVAELASRVKDGTISPDRVLTVKAVLSWVSDAAALYIPPAQAKVTYGPEIDGARVSGRGRDTSRVAFVSQRIDGTCIYDIAAGECGRGSTSSARF